MKNLFALTVVALVLIVGSMGCEKKETKANPTGGGAGTKATTPTSTSTKS